MLRPITPIEKRIIWLGVITVLTVILITLGSINRFRIFHTETGLRLLQDRFTDYKAAQDAKELALRQELDSVEKTLYTAPEVAAAPPPRRPSAVEQWELNRFKAIEDRLRALETYRYRTER